MMKAWRTAIAAVTLLCLAGGQAAGARPVADTGPMALVFQTADAVWLKKLPSGTYMYFAGGYHMDDLVAQKSKTFAFADKTKCVVVEKKHVKITVCAGSARATKVNREVFEFDTTMESTHLRWKDAKVDWAGDGLIYPDGFPFAGPFGALVYASLDREAAATGRVLGQQFTKGRWAGYLSQGVFGGVLIAARDHRVWLEGDRVHYEVRIKSPR